jgi:hypothetical protein
MMMMTTKMIMDDNTTVEQHDRRGVVRSKQDLLSLFPFPEDPEW